MLKIYNTITQKKEVFKPRKDNKINIFVCGPTVYDFSHMGHARTYISFDVIVKYLKLKYNVFYLQNITDIDNKIIDRAKERNITPKKLAQQFEKEYFKDVKSLKIDSVSKYARATDYIKDIISQVKRLEKKGFAYKINDGIYYDISKFKEYGKLSKRTKEQAEKATSRIDDSKKKRNKGDFCLWKFYQPGDPKWKSPWGNGRPGWHIEDTAITEHHFGSQYDIHGGARDLIFPHHEAEISQMEAISGKSPLVKYWTHTGFLTIKKRKMSKSLGNFITIKEFLKKHSPRILRLFILKFHYRSPVDYNEKMIIQTEKEIRKVDEFINKVKVQNSKNQTKLVKNLILKTEKDFKKAMDNDFNTPIALSVIFRFIAKGNQLIDKNKITKTDLKNIIKFLKEIDKVFTFIFWKKEKPLIPIKIKELVKLREKYRKEEQWKKSDEIRKKIKKLGYQVEDTKHGSKIKKAS